VTLDNPVIVVGVPVIYGCPDDVGERPAQIPSIHVVERPVHETTTDESVSV
jgi:hypothetical protein